jgi:hypothetical protein
MRGPELLQALGKAQESCSQKPHLLEGGEGREVWTTTLIFPGWTSDLTSEAFTGPCRLERKAGLKNSQESALCREETFPVLLNGCCSSVIGHDFQ